VNYLIVLTNQPMAPDYNLSNGAAAFSDCVPVVDPIAVRPKPERLIIPVLPTRQTPDFRYWSFLRFIEEPDELDYRNKNARSQGYGQPFGTFKT